MSQTFSAQNNVMENLFRQLEGTWTFTNSKGVVLAEIWKLNDKNYLSGESWRISGKDSILTETLEVKMEDGKLYYIPTVKGQNEDHPVKFELVRSDERKFVFENTAHDFPQRIIYHFISSTEMKATIEGDIKGTMKKIDFNFTKVIY